MKLPRRSLLWTALFGASLFTQAQATDLMSVYQMALESDPSFAAASAKRDAKRELKSQAIAAVLPNLSLSADFDRNRYEPNSGSNSTYDSRGYTVSLSQPLFDWTLFAGYSRTKALVAEAEATYADAVQAFIVRVAERYFAVLEAEDALRSARAEEEAISKQLAQANARFEVGLAAITDVREAQARADSARAALIEAENATAIEREKLRELTGQLLRDLNTLGELELSRPDPVDIDSWVEQALASNPSLLSKQYAKEAARAEISRKRGGHLPTLDLDASYAYSDTDAYGSTSASEYDKGIVGLSLKLPLFSGGDTVSQTREAQALFAESQDNYEAERRATERAVREAYLKVLSGISRVQALKQAVISNETALEAVRMGFEAGTRDAIDVLDARKELTAAEQDFSSARYAWLLDTLRLKKAAGNLKPDDLTAINQLLQK
jgi:outer membrane protein